MFMIDINININTNYCNILVLITVSEFLDIQLCNLEQIAYLFIPYFSLLYNGNITHLGVFDRKSNAFTNYSHYLAHVQMHMHAQLSSVQFSVSVMSHSLQPHELQHTRFPCPSPTPGVVQTHIHRVGNAFQPSHPVSFPSPPAFSLAQHQGLFQ